MKLADFPCSMKQAIGSLPAFPDFPRKENGTGMSDEENFSCRNVSEALGHRAVGRNLGDGHRAA